LPVNLAVSLHAPDDELRSSMIRSTAIPDRGHRRRGPGSRRANRRRTSYEYVLLQRINDSVEQARRLTTVIGHRLTHVNLIR